jgi:hypothetical protein
MKKLFILMLCLASACSKKNTTPDYYDFTPISGQCTVFMTGYLRNTKSDTTSVLSALQLRVRPDALAVNDIYEFKGNLNPNQTIDIQFYAPKNRTSSGPWTNLQVDVKASSYKNMGFGSSSTNGGTLSASGNSFLASYTSSDLRISLK